MWAGTETKDSRARALYAERQASKRCTDDQLVARPGQICDSRYLDCLHATGSRST